MGFALPPGGAAVLKRNRIVTAYARTAGIMKPAGGLLSQKMGRLQATNQSPKSDDKLRSESPGTFGGAPE
ncbi:hypothetical protein DQG13_16500 [Paenibacillus sp. YN15]|nr:hypothetical protein DQG13_16500 [Paenibacillus sp. YN15]